MTCPSLVALKQSDLLFLLSDGLVEIFNEGIVQFASIACAIVAGLAHCCKHEVKTLDTLVHQLVQ